jgi:hypothetical protein
MRLVGLEHPVLGRAGARLAPLRLRLAAIGCCLSAPQSLGQILDLVGLDELGGGRIEAHDLLSLSHNSAADANSRARIVCAGLRRISPVGTCVNDTSRTEGPKLYTDGFGDALVRD